MQITGTFLYKVSMQERMPCPPSCYIKKDGEIDELARINEVGFNALIRPFKCQANSTLQNLRNEGIIYLDLEAFDDQLSHVKNFINNQLTPIPDLGYFNLAAFKENAIKNGENDIIAIRNQINYVETKGWYQESHKPKIGEILRLVSAYKTYYCYLACLQCNVYKKIEIVEAINLMHKTERRCQDYVECFTAYQKWLVWFRS